MSKKPESLNLGEFSLTFPRKNMEKGNNFLSQSQQPYYLPPPSPISTPQASGFNLNEKVSPSILLIIIILAIIFFISGLLHLLVRFLLRPPNRDPDDWDNVTALQGQLQQLFHLHDSGVDQTFIDALPVFNYKSIIGAKSDPFDCAVCLCEFEGEDKLRLLPKCSHAFHMECIDTWLLSHSTCPLCRSNLIPDFSPSNSCSAIVLVLESGNESAREVANDGDGVSGGVNSQLGFQIEDRQFGEISQKSSEIQEFGDLGQERRKIGGSSEDKVVAVKLGKFRSINGGSEEIGANDNAEARRCFSMGSFEYVMDENSQLQVPIRTPLKKPFIKKASSLPLKPGHRPAMSECDCDSRREFNGFEPFKCEGNAIGKISSKRSESFSVSKIWLRGKKEKPSLEEKEEEESPEGRVSFRFPVSRNVDEEVQSCKSFGSEANQASYAKRTLLWFLRREKEVHSSFSSNV